MFKKIKRHKTRVGHHFFSVQNVPFFSVLLKNVSFFFEFLATYETQKNVSVFSKERETDAQPCTEHSKITEKNIHKDDSWFVQSALNYYRKRCGCGDGSRGSHGGGGCGHGNSRGSYGGGDCHDSTVHMYWCIVDVNRVLLCSHRCKPNAIHVLYCKGILSRDFGGLQINVMHRSCVPDVPLKVYSFLKFCFHIVF